MSHDPKHRRKYARDEDIFLAGLAAYETARAGWIDPLNPTPEEEVAAKLARLEAMRAAADSKVAAGE